MIALNTSTCDDNDVINKKRKYISKINEEEETKVAVCHLIPQFEKMYTENWNC